VFDTGKLVWSCASKAAVLAINQSIFLRRLSRHKHWYLLAQPKYYRGKNHCTIDLLFGWFVLVCFANKKLKFSVVTQLIPNQSNRRSPVQWYLPPLVFPESAITFVNTLPVLARKVLAGFCACAHATSPCTDPLFPWEPDPDQPLSCCLVGINLQ
jgi:hypothetical protein